MPRKRTMSSDAPTLPTVIEWWLYEEGNLTRSSLPKWQGRYIWLARELAEYLDVWESIG
jgi:hypothetical protein